MTKILIIGVCTADLGAMERQLGNAAILISTISMLKKYIPDADISTSMQLSEDFCEKYKIKSLKDKRFWRIGPRGTMESLIDLFRASLWRLFKKIGIQVKILIKSKRIKEYMKADVILDFDGDIYSSNEMSRYRLIKHSADLLTARLVGKPVIIFASTLGPFSPGPILSLIKFTLNKLTLILSREQISSDYLEKIGVKKELIKTTACPAFLLKPVSKKRAEQLLKIENININDKPLIGMTIAEANMSSGLGKMHQEENELIPFKTVIDYLTDKLGATVLLIPHVYRADIINTSSIKFSPSPDFKIAEQLYQMTRKNKLRNKIKLIRGYYSPSEVKGLIGQCDLHISGRLHSAVAAWSQCVPTIGIAYSPKFYGFSRFVNQEKYVCGSNDANDIILKIKDGWQNKKQISAELKQRMLQVEKISLLNAELVKNVIKNINQQKK